MIKTRFSPSPTGMLHLGNVRAALFSALYAKREKGHFILRIEDTDAARSEVKYAEILQEDLHWLGLDWQEGPGVEGPHGPYWQSQRDEIYAHYYTALESAKLAYPCFCTDQELALNRKLQLSRGQPPRYPGTCKKLTAEDIAQRFVDGKKAALRFQVPVKQSVDFVDLVKGPQHFNSDDIGDFIIRRAEGTASFMFCNAIDDALMGVTHVLRGEDHVANTPRQLMILQALKLHTPQYGHLSLILGDDGSPLSKRHGSFSLHDLYEQGYLPLAIINYLARLSHTYDEQRLMSFEDLASHFNFDKMSRSSARFDKNQLLHWQKEAVMALSSEGIWAWLGDDIKGRVPSRSQAEFAELVRSNCCFPAEASNWATILFSCDTRWHEDQQAVIQQAGKAFYTLLKKCFAQNGLDLKKTFDEMKATLNVSGKNLFMPVRVALTGQQHGPELAQIASLLGTETLQKRCDQALQWIKEE